MNVPREGMSPEAWNLAFIQTQDSAKNTVAWKTSEEEKKHKNETNKPLIQHGGHLETDDAPK